MPSRTEELNFNIYLILSDLKGLRLKLKLQYFGHLMKRADSLMLGKTEGRRRRGPQRIR